MHIKCIFLFTKSSRAWLNSFDVKNLLFAFLRSSWSIISFCLVAFVIIFLFGDKIILRCISSCRCAFLREQNGISFLRQHRQYRGDLSFWSFLFCMYRHLDSYKQYEPNYHNNHTGLLIDFLQQFYLETKHGYFTIVVLRVYIWSFPYETV